jgi:tRNA1(Val) A37 N6-methylase TrmN6
VKDEIMHDELKYIKKNETIDDLQLNGLKLIQKEDGFKFGIDAVLLSDFAYIKNKHKVIDLCTGTGIIPFLVYGKYAPESVYGLEIQEDMIEMANRSVQLNSLEKKIFFLNEDLKNIEFLKKLQKFDIVTVNPPYKLNNAGILNPNDKLAIARHEILCNLEDVISASRVLLKDNGRLFMIHRPERLADIFTLMRKYKIEPKRVKMIHPKIGKAPNIVLVEGQRDGGAYLKWDEPLYVYDSNGKYTKEINEIYGRL